jgi:hypothetical protein
MPSIHRELLYDFTVVIAHYLALSLTYYVLKILKYNEIELEFEFTR